MVNSQTIGGASRPSTLSAVLSYLAAFLIGSAPLWPLLIG